MLTDISVKMAKNLLKKKNYYASDERDERRKSYGDAESDKGICGTI